MPHFGAATNGAAESLAIWENTQVFLIARENANMRWANRADAAPLPSVTCVGVERPFDGASNSA
jgi:hypothetical protein